VDNCTHFEARRKHDRPSHLYAHNSPTARVHRELFNPLKIRSLVVSIKKQLESFVFFVGDDKIGVGLRISDRGHRTWAPIPRVNFLKPKLGLLAITFEPQTLETNKWL